MRLKFHSFEFDIWALSKEVLRPFFTNENSFLFQQAENLNAADGTHQITFKIDKKCWRNFKLSSQVII
jgi:hypothetical protein